MLKKIKYLAANLIAPGIGHFAMKRWIQGLIYFLGAIGCLVWLVIAFVKKIIVLYNSTMETPDSSFDGLSVLIALLLPIGSLIAIWLISFIDLCFFSAIPEKNENPDN